MKSSPCQIGCSAATKILDSVLDGLNIESNAALFVIDINPGVGNMFDAFIAKRPTVNYNMQYVATMPDQVTAEWFLETKAGDKKLTLKINPVYHSKGCRDIG